MSSGKPFGWKPWSQPLADLVAPCLSPALARFGFSEADLLMYWPEIVGERLASRCEPLRLQWPARAPRQERSEPAVLIVRVEGSFALELQHQSALVIERVNAHLGWRCIGKLALKQGPLAKKTLKRQPVAPPEAEAVQRASAAAGGIAEDGLRDALVRLGGRVLSPKRAG